MGISRKSIFILLLPALFLIEFTGCTPQGSSQSAQESPSTQPGQSSGDYVEAAEVTAEVTQTLSEINQDQNYKIDSNELDLLKQERVISDAEIAELKTGLKL